jgi:hypothetical protein
MAKSIVRVKVNKPTVTVPNWTKEATLWRKLYREAGGSSRLSALTVKAGYVIGAMHGICQCVSHLLQHPKAQSLTYVPAFQAFGSAVELLGRCIRGNTDLWGNVADLQAGFKWLANSDQVGLEDDTTVLKTRHREYTVDMLTALGHYAGTSPATAKRTTRGMHHAGSIDLAILEKLPPLLAAGLDRYWQKLQDSERMCNRLAQARLIGLSDWPVLDNWLLRKGQDGGSVPALLEVFAEFDWSVAGQLP